MKIVILATTFFFHSIFHFLSAQIITPLVEAAGTNPPVMVNAASYSGPIIIVQGGTYQGDWTSIDPTVPVVEIRTSSEVTIENSCLKGPGNLVFAPKINSEFVKVNVKNSTLIGDDPINFPHNSKGLAAGIIRPEIFRFLNNEVTGTSGIHIHNGIAKDTILPAPVHGHKIRIQKNSFLNLDGRMYDASGDMIKIYNGQSSIFPSDFYGNNCSSFPNNQGMCFNYQWRWAFAVKITNLKNVDAQIRWNQVVNRPNESAVEDVINLFNASAVPSKPIIIENNFIWGAYPYGDTTDLIGDPNSEPSTTQIVDAYINNNYSGGGINIGDGCIAYNQDEYRNREIIVRNNQIVGTTRYGIGIGAGTDIEVYGNVIVASGEGPDVVNGSNRKVAAQNNPLPWIHRSRGMYIETYQPPNYPCNPSANHQFQPPIQYGGRGWREDTLLGEPGNNSGIEGISVYDNLIWWKRDNYDPGLASNIPKPYLTWNGSPFDHMLWRTEPGTFDGPPNTEKGFYFVNPWVFTGAAPTPLSSGNYNQNDPLWFDRTQIRGEIITPSSSTAVPGPVNTFKAFPISYADEIAQWNQWLGKASANGKTIGLLSPGPCDGPSPNEKRSQFEYSDNFQEIAVFPNPVSSVLSIRIPSNYEPESGYFGIRNSLGTKIMEGQIQKIQVDIDISHLEPGAYFIEFLFGTKIERKEFVKK